MKSVFLPIQVIVQLVNDYQPPQWGAPLLLAGVNMILDDNNTIKYQPAHAQRPMSSSDFTPEILGNINTQLAELGYKLSPLES